MENHRPPELEMTINGEFVTPPKAPITARILFWAIVVAAIAGALTLAAFAISVALFILPVAVAAAAVAWLMFRYRVWRMQRDIAARRTVRRR